MGALAGALTGPAMSLSGNPDIEPPSPKWPSLTYLRHQRADAQRRSGATVW